MAVTMETRSTWGANPPKGTLAQWPSGGPTHIVYHYVGGANFAAIPADHKVCLSFIKSIQLYEMSIGYTDVAYNLFVCGHGKVIEGRGMHVRSGAQFGDNDDGLAVCFLMNVPNTMSAGFARGGADARVLVLSKYSGCRTYDGHQNCPDRATAATSCPGVAVMLWIAAKGPEKTTTTVPTTKVSGAVKIVTTPAGYYMVASDGGVFTFGDAKFFGSMGGKALNAPIVGMAVKPQLDGYILVGADGGTFRFGNVKDHGNIYTYGIKLAAPITGIDFDLDGDGYVMAGADGGVFAFGTKNYGNATAYVNP